MTEDTIEHRPFTYTIQQLTELTGLSRSSIYQEIRTGRLQKINFGTRVLVTEQQVRDWIEVTRARSAAAQAQR